MCSIGIALGRGGRRGYECDPEAVKTREHVRNRTLQQTRLSAPTSPLHCCSRAIAACSFASRGYTAWHRVQATAPRVACPCALHPAALVVVTRDNA